MDLRKTLWRSALRIGAALLVALILQLALAGDARAGGVRVWDPDALFHQRVARLT